MSSAILKSIQILLDACSVVEFSYALGLQMGGEKKKKKTTVITA